MLHKVNFNKALIISFLWHIFCFFAFTIVIVPIAIRQKGFSDISFLGPVLDEGSFQAKIQDLDPHLAQQRQSRSSPFLLPAKTEGTEKIDISRERNHFLKERPYRDSIDELLETEKEFPPSIDEGKGLIEGRVAASAENKKDFSIEGQARDRVLIFRPPFSDYGGPSKTYNNVRLRVVIAADGNVKSVDIIETSGEPKTDLAAIRYVKKWKFTPLNPDKPQHDQEGILSLRHHKE
jgi:TonB family protein